MLFDFVKKQPPLADEAERIAWLRLCRTDNVGPISFYNFINYYGSASAALAAIPEINKKKQSKRPYRIPPMNVIERELNALSKLGGRIVTAADDDYPLALSAISDAPPVISVIGRTELLNRSSIAIVGARNASLNGRKFAARLAKNLGEQGEVVISGLARGIDTAAHEGALDTGTIAVVAGGIDVVYPQENQKLYEAICDRGAVIAENPLGTAPRATDFPRRNRIVSGISSGVVVIEATLRSGSLITARLAGEQGREVYAVPGHPYDPRAEGPNALIRDGAVLVRNADDILEHTRDFSGAMPRTSPLFETKPKQYSLLAQNTSKDIENPPANDAPTDINDGDINDQILACLSSTPCEINELIRTTGLDTATAQAALMELEIFGQIQRLSGGRVCLTDS